MFQLLLKFIRKIFGSRNDRVVKRLRKVVEAANQLEDTMQGLSDEQLQSKTQELKQRVADGASLDDVQSEAFAVVREAAVRVHSMRHYDVQLVGGLVLHQGKVAEMRTGEGKTLVATLAAYLNALSGKGVHVITVNDYLARRDGETMAQVYNFLGLSVGIINSSGGMGPDSSSYLFDADYAGNEGGYLRLRPASRKQAYAADITYGTNNEFGFDYLRDNMAFSLEDKVQRELNYAIIDEVDSILIDEARTPLIISGPTNDNSELYIVIDKLAPSLQRSTQEVAEGEEPDGDFAVDEKTRSITLTEQGHERVEAILTDAGILADGGSLYDPSNIALMHFVDAALKAHHVFQRDVQYVVEGGEVVIVDEFTGRKMPGRRWSDGLHQAVEAKEGVEIQNENQTLASITYQNYFRLYEKLSGMTGTADTEASELVQIYGLEVIVIPTHKPMVRDDRADLVYMTMQEKYQAIIADIRESQAKQQPVLVGTASIETSEILNGLLKKEGIKHEILNAKQHEREAHIVAQAGYPGAVTIATNMAGRGTDIVLGGSFEEEINNLENPSDTKIEKIKQDWAVRHQQVLDSGGLHIIGSERHESRRIDNQLRGRAGRQGDPGASRFYLSLEDNLMRIFASDKVKGLMQRMGMEEGEAIEHPWLSKAIENAQRKVEGHNYDMRKNILEYDNVANDQRKVIYEQRAEVMGSNDISATIIGLREDVIGNLFANFIPQGSLEERWDIEGLTAALKSDFAMQLPIQQWLDEEDELYEENLLQRIMQSLLAQYEVKEELLGAEDARRFEKQIMLWVLDSNWKDHLAAMDYLRKGIGFRSSAQKDPKQEYKRESFQMFKDLIDRIKEEVVSKLHLIEVQSQAQVDELEEQNQQSTEINYGHGEAEAESEAATQPEQRRPVGPAPVRTPPKVGRNEPCPCGSGKKYKQCHGKLA